MKNLFLLLVVSLSAPAFANLGHPEQVHIDYSGPYAFPEPVKRAVINALTDVCFYHQNSYSWSGAATLISDTTYSYKIEMSGADAQSPHQYVYASMTVQYDAALKIARSLSNLKCN